MTQTKPSVTGRRKQFVLTERHKRFCRSIVAGMAHTAAYFDAGFSGKGASAYLLYRRLEIQRYIEYLQERQRIRLNVTMDRLVLDLCKAQELAEQTGNAAAHVSATMGLAKLMGFLKEDRAGDINIYINRPLREPTKELELSPDQWIAKWAPAELVKPNGHANGNGQDQG